MDKNYLNLFRELAHTTEILAEQVMELNHSKEDVKGEETATIMRNDYAKLYEMLRSEDFNPDILTKRDYAKLLVGAAIVAQQLDNKIAAETKAINGYKVDVMPKLERIINEAEKDEDVLALATELFTIKDSEESNT